MNLPEGYQTVMPYLILTAADSFIDFAKKVFGAKEQTIHRTGQGRVMHAEIRIGESTIMIGETSDEWSVQNAGLYINVENADTTFGQAVANGAEIIMPLENKDYGRCGGVKDPTGNTWWITSPLEK